MACFLDAILTSNTEYTYSVIDQRVVKHDALEKTRIKIRFSHRQHYLHNNQLTGFVAAVTMMAFIEEAAVMMVSMAAAATTTALIQQQQRWF